MKGFVMSTFGAKSSQGLSILAALIAIALAENLDLDDLNVLGNFVTAIGGILLTIAAQEAIIQAKQADQAQNDIISQQIDILNKQVSLLKVKLDK